VSYAVVPLFLFNPFAIDTAMSGIRNGLAWSLVIVGFMIQSNALRMALFMTGMFVHSSTLVLAVLYYFTQLVSRFKEREGLLFGGLGIGIFMGLSLTVGSELFLGAIGDRRQGQAYLVGGGSFLQASLWAALLGLQCMSGRTYIRQNIFVIAVLAWYLTMNPFVPWSYRIYGAFLPVIAAAAMNLSHRKRQLFIYLYSGYVALQYLYWSKLFDYWYPA
jgi:drug/metabolite transporter superfamily protein YnfA